MGIGMSGIRQMEAFGLLAAGRRILDIGSSNLYAAAPDEIADFVRRHAEAPRADLEAWADTLAAGAGTDAAGTALNQAFVGEMFEAAGMGYDALDIAVGYKTTVLDLNHATLPAEMVGAYDTVLNCGTSEHILNQMNCFAAIHAAVKPGGLIMHSVPSIGYVDHGYFCYTSRFFFDLAAYNKYEIVDMWYEGPHGEENMFASARQYQSLFPAVKDRLGRIGTEDRETALNRIAVPMIAIGLIYRKTEDTPFMGTVETSTSVGEVPSDVFANYSK